MECIKFIKPMANYRVDDVAAFEDKMADKIVAAGYGEKIDLEETKIVNDKKK